MTLLARRFPASDKTQKEKEETIAQLQLANYNHFLALIDHKDKNVHKYIEKLVDPTAEYQTLRTTKACVYRCRFSAIDLCFVVR